MPNKLGKMNLEKKLAGFFGLKGDRWLNHANPKSVYSRFTVLPLVIVSVWSRVWIDELFLIPFGLTLLWAFLNPRLFKKPDSTKNWASKGVLGERIWQNRENYEIPNRHSNTIGKLVLVSGLGAVPFVHGLYTLNLWVTLTGFTAMFLGKLWFFDRMVWLFEDLKEREEFEGWLY